MSDVWKQCARSPLGGDDSGLIISPSSLRLCPYNRLQILQSLCPAAAAAIMILGGQMPEMRSGNYPNQSPSHHASAVTAEAWCPRTLMTTEGIEDLLLFSMPDGLVSLHSFLFNYLNRLQNKIINFLAFCFFFDA